MQTGSFHPQAIGRNPFLAMKIAEELRHRDAKLSCQIGHRLCHLCQSTGIAVSQRVKKSTRARRWSHSLTGAGRSSFFLAMCNLYSFTTAQAAARALFRTVADLTGNLPPLPAIGQLRGSSLRPYRPSGASMIHSRLRDIAAGEASRSSRANKA
jgi:hypothetical protein